MSLTLVYSTQQQNATFSKHLKQSCGIDEVEILQFINPGHYSLSQIYNYALTRAEYDLIVFVHDDVIFETPHWGINLINHFTRSDFGILGVAGTTDLPNTGIWWQDKTKMMGIIKHHQNGKTWTSRYCDDFGDKILPAVCVDGVFIAVQRKRIHTIFNESLPGFHFYDIDFCLTNHVVGVKIGVIFNIKLIHHSIGTTNEQWENNRLRFIASHAYHLPCYVKGEIFIDTFPIILSHYPSVSIIILHKSHNYLLFNCLLSITEKSTYPNYEIIIADTGSSMEELAEIDKFILSNSLKIKIIKFNYYHFAHVNNAVVSSVKSELLLFCNNDIELINDAISRMVQVYVENSENCGTIGCRLYFANGTIQHAGIDIVLHSKQDLKISHKGFISYYQYIENVEANILGSTAAFLLIEKNLFNKMGGFNPNYLDCLEDVELNLACISDNKINFFAGNAACYHFESQTRNTKGLIQAEDYQRLLRYVQSNPEIAKRVYYCNK